MWGASPRAAVLECRGQTAQLNPVFNERSQPLKKTATETTRKERTVRDLSVDEAKQVRGGVSLSYDGSTLVKKARNFSYYWKK